MLTLLADYVIPHSKADVSPVFRITHIHKETTFRLQSGQGLELCLLGYSDKGAERATDNRVDRDWNCVYWGTMTRERSEQQITGWTGIGTVFIGVQ
jgi:hypothetical protein